MPPLLSARMLLLILFVLALVNMAAPDPSTGLGLMALAVLFWFWTGRPKIFSFGRPSKKKPYLVSIAVARLGGRREHNLNECFRRLHPAWQVWLNTQSASAPRLDAVSADALGSGSSLSRTDAHDRRTNARTGSVA